MSLTNQADITEGKPPASVLRHLPQTRKPSRLVFEIEDGIHAIEETQAVCIVLSKHDILDWAAGMGGTQAKKPWIPILVGALSRHPALVALPRRPVLVALPWHPVLAADGVVR